jgi:hypothetical protein
MIERALEPRRIEVNLGAFRYGEQIGDAVGFAS